MHGVTASHNPRLLAALLLLSLTHVRCFRTATGPNTGVTGVIGQDAELLKQEVEAKTEAVERGVEALGSKLESADVDVKPIKGGFRVGESLDKLDTRTGFSPWFEAQMTAKHPEAAARFVKTLTTSFAEFGLDQQLSARSQGAAVTVSTSPVPLHSNFFHAFDTFAKHIHHVELTTESVDFDLVGLLKNHSNKLILQEMYRGLEVSIDAGLTPALEAALLDFAVPAEAKSRIKLMLKMFAGLFFNIRLGYNGEALQAALVNVPGLNTTAEGLLDHYRQLGQQIPVSVRGHPMFVKGLQLLQAADDDLWRLDSLEVKGMPSGVRVLIKLENVNPFAFYNTVLKEAGLHRIFRNETRA